MHSRRRTNLKNNKDRHNRLACIEAPDPMSACERQERLDAVLKTLSPVIAVTHEDR